MAIETQEHKRECETGGKNITFRFERNRANIQLTILPRFLRFVFTISEIHAVTCVNNIFMQQQVLGMYTVYYQ